MQDVPWIKRFAVFSLLIALMWAGMGRVSSYASSQKKIKAPHHEVEVVLIEIPVYATDKHGNPILDLKPEEFIVEEDGKRQKITHFVLVKNDSPEIATLLQDYPAARRQFLLFFDFAFATPAKILRARTACKEFVKNKMLPTDLAALATYSGIGGLKILSNFSSDREQLYHVIDTLGLIQSDQRMTGPVGFSFPGFEIGGTPTDPAAGGGPSADSRRDTFASDQEIMGLLARVQQQGNKVYAAYVTDFINEFGKLSTVLSSIKGRKHLIYFSEGFDSKVLTGKSLQEMHNDSEAFADGNFWTGGVDTKDQFGDTGLRTALYDALHRVASADCPIHTIDIGGLRTQAGGLGSFSGSGRDIQSIRRGQDTLTVLSSETGGMNYRNVNDLNEPLENLIQVTNTHYIIAYQPENARKDGKYRKIRIKTTRAGAEISYRKGYYEAKPYNKLSTLEKRLHLVEYVINDIEKNEIQFDAFVTAFQGIKGISRVPVFLKFPGRQFLDRRATRLEIYGYAITKDGVFKDFFHQALNINTKKVQSQLEKAGVKYYDLHLVPPGEYKIKVIVRDRDTGAVGSVIEGITVPDFESGNLAMTGPVFAQQVSGWMLSRGYDPQKPAGRKAPEGLPIEYPYMTDGEQFIPGVTPALSRTEPALFFLRVHNLQLHPKTKVPQTEMNFEIVNSQGDRSILRNVGLIKAPSQLESGAYELLFQMNTGGYPPGWYKLRVTFKDSLSKQEVVSEASFIL